MIKDLGALGGIDINFKQKVHKEKIEPDLYPLHVAASTGDEHIVKILLQNKGLDIN